MQLLKTEYYKRNASNKNDKIILVCKDSDGKKQRITYKNPKFHYFITDDPECEDEVYKYIEIGKVRKVECYYKNLIYSIRDELNDERITRLCREAFTSGENIQEKLGMIHLDTRLHGTDLNIQDYYVGQFLDDNDFEHNYFGISKFFYDIEVDSHKFTGFPDANAARGEVNAISYFDDNTHELGIFYLRYPDLKSFRKFEKNFKNIKKELDKKYNQDFKEILKYDFDIKFAFNAFDDEAELIYSFFNMINERKPDFASAWNADYDFQYLHNRLAVLGYDPAEIMCPEELPKDEKKAWCKIDTKSTDPAEKNSTYYCSGYTEYVDEMFVYANITKPLGKEESYSLDYIANKVAGIHKDEVEGNMKFFHLKNYTKFWMYNIQDSFALAMIERKTNHLDLLYNVSMITRTRLSHAMKKTVSIRNLMNKYALMQGFVMSNNRSKIQPKLAQKAKGALTYRRTVNLFNCWNSFILIKKISSKACII